jgi:hypothetical protein
MNPIMVAQKETIPAIAHAIVLERVKWWILLMRF